MAEEGSPGPRSAARDGRRGPDWRADPAARSQHSRLAEELREPVQDFDQERAAALCAALCRELLGDFAPCLLLLERLDRERVQTLVAYAYTLFDFARQHGVEGERLAQINRWEFTLETALSGQAVGQPIFLGMAREHLRRPWPAESLDELAACARKRATRPRPATPREAEADAQRLARAFAASLLGAPPPEEISLFAGALVRLYALQNLGSEVAKNRNPLPQSELPDDLAPPAPGPLLAAARRECERLRPRLLKAPRGLVELPPGYRRAAVYSLLAALRLLSRIEDADANLLDRPPHLGSGSVWACSPAPAGSGRGRNRHRRGPGGGALPASGVMPEASGVMPEPPGVMPDPRRGDLCQRSARGFPSAFFLLSSVRLRSHDRKEVRAARLHR